MLDSLLRFFIRTFSFIRKEMVEIWRQPRLVFTLILGPFLILLIFGIGYRNVPQTLETLFVVSEDSEMEDLVRQYADNFGPQLEFAGIIHDADEADRRLRNEEVDLVVVAPSDPYAALRNSEKSVFQLYHYEIDPFEETYVQVLGRNYMNELNRQAVLAMVEEGKKEAGALQEKVSIAQENAAAARQAFEQGDQIGAQQKAQALNDDLTLITAATGAGLAAVTALQPGASSEGQDVAEVLEQLKNLQQELDTEEIAGSTLAASSSESFATERETAAEIEAELTQLDTLLTEFRQIDSEVLVAPFESEILSITNVNLEAMHFFVPAALALLLQHMAITIASLSIVREQREGAMELFRASPVSAFETLLGKYSSYLLLTGLLAAILSVLIVYLLGVPMLGNWLNYSLVILALLGTSLGVGFIISLVARSDSQAIQYAMIVLLASIFFSGLFLPLYRLWVPVRVLSWTLPATYGTTLLQSIMLRGQTASFLLHGILAIMAVSLFLIAWWRLHRMMARE